MLAALTSLCELGLFQKMRIWELMSATLGFLYHPNVWIRQGAVAIYYSPPCLTLGRFLQEQPHSYPHRLSISPRAMYGVSYTRLYGTSYARISDRSTR